MSFDSAIDRVFAPVADVLESVVFFSIPLTADGSVQLSLILLWLLSAAVFFTVYLNFVTFAKIPYVLSTLWKNRKDVTDHASDGQITSFQALATSLSGTVGLGNIAGVAVAISLGGVGASFWMAMMGFLGMAVKFAEATLSIRYRQHEAIHTKDIAGGPMYYLRMGLSDIHRPRLGKFLSVLFCFCCIGGAIGGGNMFQANQAYSQAVIVMGGAEGFLGQHAWVFGLFLAVLVGLVILGGIEEIAAVTSKLVPFMTLLYMVLGLSVIALRITELPSALAWIVRDAVDLKAGFGAFVGTMLVGIQRASFSNEAGLGSAPIAHSTAKVSHPIQQGLVAMLEPVADTVIICMMTALVITITKVTHDPESATAALKGVALTSAAFETTITGSRYVLALVVFLFAYSTMITWFYYGLKSLNFLVGDKDWVQLLFKVFYCALIFVGTSANLSNVVRFTDSMFFIMAIPNVIGLYFLAPEVKRLKNDYFDRYIQKT
jgi:AGCS family alanine or glycine:cation symporter